MAISCKGQRDAPLRRKPLVAALPLPLDSATLRFSLHKSQDILSLQGLCARINPPFIVPHPICIAHTVAILVHDDCAV